MHSLRRTSTPQRVVLVVALGLLLLSGWAWWYAGEVDPAGGWFAYSPQAEGTDLYFTVRERRPIELIVPIALVVTWAAVSYWLLGLKPRQEDAT